MKFLSLNLILGLGLALLVQSSPIEERKLPANECNVVDEIVLLLKLAAATPFCSSFLSIPVATAVSTSTTSATVVATTSPLTVSTATLYTSTETDVDIITSTASTSTMVVTTFVTTTTSIASVTTTTTTFEIIPKRDLLVDRDFKLPSFLQKFASAEISTACSCLSIPQSTSKTTTTTVATISATATSSVTETISTDTTTSTATTVLTDLVVSGATTTTVSQTATVTTVGIVTDCPQAIQDPGFENGKNVSPWVVVDNVPEGTYSESYSAGSYYCHTGQYCFIFDYINEDNLDGSLIFSLSQKVTILCPKQQLTLGFWLRYDDYTGNYGPCNLQLCVGSQCQLFEVVNGNESVQNEYVYYSFLGPVPDGTTTSLEISISANGGTAGMCTATTLYFDDFTLE